MTLLRLASAFVSLAPVRLPCAAIGIGQATRAAVVSPPMLRLSETAYAQMIGHAYDCLPEEACGLMAGVYGGERAPLFYPCRNEADSSKVYTVDTRAHLR